MSEEQVEARPVELEEKDITSLVEDVEKDLEEIDELVEAEEEDLGVSETGGLMTEEEFNARLDEFQEKPHQIIKWLDLSVKTLETKARNIGADIDFSIWWDIGRPSMNAGLWYEEKVKGRIIRVSGEWSLLVGVGSLFLLVWMYKKAVDEVKRKRPSEVKQQGTVEGRTSRQEAKAEDRPVKTETERLREKAKPREPEPPKSEVLAKIAKNLGS